MADYNWCHFDRRVELVAEGDEKRPGSVYRRLWVWSDNGGRARVRFGPETSGGVEIPAGHVQLCDSSVVDESGREVEITRHHPRAVEVFLEFAETGESPEPLLDLLCEVFPELHRRIDLIFADKESK